MLRTAVLAAAAAVLVAPAGVAQTRRGSRATIPTTGSMSGSTARSSPILAARRGGLAVNSNPMDVVGVTAQGTFRMLRSGIFDVMSAMIAHFGATPVTRQFPRVYPALQRGVVSCGMTSPTSANTGKRPEVTTHLLTLAVSGSVQGHLVNLDAWNRFSPGERAALTETFAAVMLAMVGLLILFPGRALWLPEQMFGAPG